jgi:hypothetical protein
LEHFDAIKIRLTATPGAHTTGYFRHQSWSSGFGASALLPRARANPRHAAGGRNRQKIAQRQENS